jgi:hypothetical protein
MKKLRADDTPKTNFAPLSALDTSAVGERAEFPQAHCPVLSTEQTIASDWVKSIGEDCSKAPLEYLNRRRLPQSGE